MIIKNKYIPFRGFTATAVWPFILVRKDCALTERTMRHEKIHHAQQREITTASLFIFTVLGAVLNFSLWLILIPVFMPYILYALVWFWHLAINTHFENPKDAYKRICFEREAYAYNRYSMYLKVRKPFAWLKHILKKD
jgi:hypothetical protein